MTTKACRIEDTDREHYIKPINSFNGIFCTIKKPNEDTSSLRGDLAGCKHATLCNLFYADKIQALFLRYRDVYENVFPPVRISGCITRESVHPSASQRRLNMYECV